ncbi:hypothetical protein CDAR_239811 [Caerostris darwini]|uniref:Uncharacterized protein n=1 Tax=Caerostris darwini TaxID=1538125 RepID=A0AAV4R292_9ARAC|nr:hypothetical protein CDAR_239811 [Caerostris darwini]
MQVAFRHRGVKIGRAISPPAAERRSTISRATSGPLDNNRIRGRSAWTISISAGLCFLDISLSIRDVRRGWRGGWREGVQGMSAPSLH